MLFRSVFLLQREREREGERVGERVGERERERRKKEGERVGAGLKACSVPPVTASNTPINTSASSPASLSKVSTEFLNVCVCVYVCGVCVCGP